MDQKVAKMAEEMGQIFGATPEQAREMAKQGNKLAILGFEHEKANRFVPIIHLSEFIY